TMRQAGEKRGVSLKLGHRVVDTVIDDGGRVIGVMAHTGRRTTLIRARLGVIFASGGFLMDRAMSRQFLKGKLAGGCSAEANLGEFVTIAGKLGARFGNMSQAWWTQTVLEMSL